MGVHAMSESQAVNPLVWYVLGVVVYLAACGLAGLYVAGQKGRGDAEGFWFGALFGPLGLVVVASLPEGPHGKRTLAETLSGAAPTPTSPPPRPKPVPTEAEIAAAERRARERAEAARAAEERQAAELREWARQGVEVEPKERTRA
jgi:hypothetical protein